jgi:HD-like signal output (HDOD) protein
MRKLLLVPADARACQDLATAVRFHKPEWEAYIVSSPEIAVGRLKEMDWDAVAAALDSPSGRFILTRAREAFPEIVRIGVVPPSQLKMAQLSFVHQTVSDLLDLEELELALERSCRLQDLLRGERLCRTLGELGELPAAPTVYLQLVAKLNQPGTSVGEVAAIIEGDPAISAKLLQVVNSIVFRTTREIATVKMAASFLGLDVLKNLVLSTEAFRAFEKISIPGFSLDELQAHSRLTAAIAGQMDVPDDLRDAAIVAGLLHDIGKLVIAYKMPERFERLWERARVQNKPLFQIEEELWGITHAEVGAYLLGLWGLPTIVTETIAYHHAPAAVPHRRFDALAAVHVANLLAHGQEGSCDSSLLQNWGVADRLPSWTNMARRTGLHARESSRPEFRTAARQATPKA